MGNTLLRGKNDIFFSNKDVLPDYAPVPNFKVGDKLLNRYEVKELFNGAMGDVYHCYDSRRSIDVALKTIISDKKEDRLQVECFYYETERRLQITQHPNVLALKRIENIDGYYYIVSEWVFGDGTYGNSMSTWIERYKFSLPEIVNFMQQMLAGLTHCHKSLGGIDKLYIFGDLKPDNILIDKRHILKLADFSGGYTPGWSAPEQSKGSTVTPDVRSDIYCLAAIASAMLSKIAEFGNPLRSAIDDLLEQCLEPDINYRIPSLQDLNNALNSICEQFGLEPYVDPNARPYSYADNPIRFNANMNPRYYLPRFLSMSDQSFARIKRRRAISMEDFCEFTYGDDRILYEAKLDFAQGNIAKALESLRGKTGSAELLCTRAIMFRESGDLDSAMRDLDAAILKDNYLPAYDLMANWLLDFPDRANAYRPKIGINLEKLEKFPKNRFVGYLANQALAKYYMLCGRDNLAVSSFRKSLCYPNFDDEWRTLYYYGCCEYRDLNISRAKTIFLHAIELVQADVAYLNNRDKCVNLLFCNNLVGNLDEIARLSLHIRDTFHMDYSSLVPLLQQDLERMNRYMQAIHNFEEKFAFDLPALQSELHQMMDDIETNRQFSNLLVRAETGAAIASRETYCAVQGQQYDAAIAICDRALSFDHSNPDILRNREACKKALETLKEFQDSGKAPEN